MKKLISGPLSLLHYWDDASYYENGVVTAIWVMCLKNKTRNLFSLKIKNKTFLPSVQVTGPMTCHVAGPMTCHVALTYQIYIKTTDIQL